MTKLIYRIVSGAIISVRRSPQVRVLELMFRRSGLLSTPPTSLSVGDAKFIESNISRLGDATVVIFRQGYLFC